MLSLFRSHFEYDALLSVVSTYLLPLGQEQGLEPHSSLLFNPAAGHGAVAASGLAPGAASTPAAEAHGGHDMRSHGGCCSACCAGWPGREARKAGGGAGGGAGDARGPRPARGRGGMAGGQGGAGRGAGGRGQGRSAPPARRRRSPGSRGGGRCLRGAGSGPRAPTRLRPSARPAQNPGNPPVAGAGRSRYYSGKGRPGPPRKGRRRRMYGHVRRRVESSRVESPPCLGGPCPHPAAAHATQTLRPPATHMRTPARDRRRHRGGTPEARPARGQLARPSPPRLSGPAGGARSARAGRC